MEKKLLTVSIAAYNVDRYIEEALNSMIIPEIMDKLEVFIVDDGSMDSIEKKVERYTSEWGNTFHYIKKENGGYGSTVNWSIAHATGKFIKLLDGDDYFNKDGLKSLIDVLEKAQADAVVSQAYRVYPDMHRKEIFTFMSSLNNGTVIPITEAVKYASVAVWGYTFRTDIVKANWRDLPEHHFYTDRLFVLQALYAVKTIYYHTEAVYNYRVGLNEQSTSVASIRKHYKEALRVDKRSLEFYTEMKKNDYDSRRYIEQRLALDYAYTFCMFLDLPIKSENLNQLKEYDITIRSYDPCIYELAPRLVKRVWLIRRSGYICYYLWPIIKMFRKN